MSSEFGKAQCVDTSLLRAIMSKLAVKWWIECTLARAHQMVSVTGPPQ